jgi:hypothetical protein
VAKHVLAERSKRPGGIKELDALATPERLEFAAWSHSLRLAQVVDDGLHRLLDVTIVELTKLVSSDPDDVERDDATPGRPDRSPLPVGIAREAYMFARIIDRRIEQLRELVTRWWFTEREGSEPGRSGKQSSLPPLWLHARHANSKFSQVHANHPYFDRDR